MESIPSNAIASARVPQILAETMYSSRQTVARVRASSAQPSTSSDALAVKSHANPRRCRWETAGWGSPGVAPGRSRSGTARAWRGAAPGQAVAVGVQVEHLVSELLVVAMHLVDDLLRAADQGRAALDGVLERSGRPAGSPPPADRRQPGLEDRPVVVEGFLRGPGGVVARRCRRRPRVRRIVAVERPAFPVVADQLGVRLDRVGDVRGEQRVAVPGGQIHGLLAGGAAVPDPDRLLQRARPGLGLVQRRAGTGRPR